MHLSRMKLTNLLSNKNIKILGFFILLGLVYAVIVRYTSFCIPCFFNTITGLKCPGCGVTHMLLSLMELDFSAAFYANPFLFTTIPILLLLLVLHFFCNENIRKKPFTKGLTTSYAIALLVWAVIRNIIKL